VSGRRPVFIGLGSNLGDRRAELESGLADLAGTPGVRLVARSRLYETEPEGGPPQGPYLNAVAEIETELGPRELLACLHAIEARHGRRRDVRFSPRSLDLDLLLYGTERVSEPGLVVPHPRLHERGFVLEPLCELAPDFPHPELGETLAQLAARVRDPRRVRLLPE
jgi:2-amino-4-hydroxy-6-hydroxymethyldihydropteridine diphosphokinase